MNFDLRLPLGLMFSIYGVVLVVMGLTTDKAVYEKSLQININLVWGIVMLIFGAAMLFFSLRAKKGAAPSGETPVKNTQASTKPVSTDKPSV